MIVSALLLVAGLGLLVKGAEWLVEGATILARRKKISDLAIGLTIVAFGTSTPELVVNIIASLEGHEEIVFGNVIGSNNFNLFFILGLTGLITPLIVQSSTVRKEIPISFLAAVLLYLLANNFFVGTRPVLSRMDGVILLIFFCFFLFYVYRQNLIGQKKPEEIKPPKKKFSIYKTVGYILGGLLSLVLGGKLMVVSATEMAINVGISQEVIGLTIVAAGTSLPELATSVVAALKKNNDIAVGNIVGSNIFNILFILGCSGLLRPLDYNPVFNADLHLLFGGTILLFLFMYWGGKRSLNRREAGILVAIYSVYTLLLVLQ